MMKYMTAYVQSGSDNNAVILQQLLRRDGVPVCLLAILSPEPNERNVLSPQEKTADPAHRLLTWFYDTVLPACSCGSPGRCTDLVFRLFQNQGKSISAFAVIFAMGEQCFYAWQGQAEIHLFQLCFGRVRDRRLTGLASRQCERAIIEPGVGVLMGNRCFFEHLNPDDLAACLQVPELKLETQLERHLAEAAAQAQRKGAEETAAVFLLPVAAQTPINI